MTLEPGNGLATIASRHSVEDTVAKLESILQAKGIKLFAVIDHSGEAKKAGLDLRPTKVLIFGNPLAGTELMVAAPSVAIDLPLKILISEDASGTVWISYNDPAYLQARHGFPKEMLPNIAGIAVLAARAAE